MTNLDIIQAGYAAFARHDTAAVFASFAPDVVWDTPASVPGGGRHVGIEAVGQFFAGFSERYAELRVQPHTWLEAQDHVVAIGSIAGVGRATGTAIDVPCVQIWELRDGRAVKVTEFLDSAVLSQALGGVQVAAR